MPDYCLHCCLERNRCTCDDATKNQPVENYPFCLPAGALLDGKYRIGRVLGAGGFGITYLAVDENLRSRVAIKEYMPRADAVRSTDGHTVIPGTHDDKSAFEFGVEKFIEEARVLARISEKDNPRIVSILNFFRANNTAYLVMRYLEGQTLAGLLKSRGGGLREDEAVVFLTAMLDGLREIHNEGLIHRDIKPQNVFITNDGGLKLIDFGAARYAHGAKSRGLTQVYTPPYAPFEQYSQQGNQGAWTDLYAVGVTFYQMLTGRLPNDALSRLEDPLIELPHAATGGRVSKALDDVVAKAICPQVNGRFRTVDEFHQALSLPSVVELDSVGASQQQRQEGPPVTSPISSGIYCLRCGFKHSRCTCDAAAKGGPVQNQPPGLPAGTLLHGKYRIGRVLSSGGFGITYLAVDEELGLRVAIKEYMSDACARRGTDGYSVEPVAPKDKPAFESGIKDFLEEAQVLASISEKRNSGLVSVKVYNYFEANGTAYLVMRYVEG
ncbi:MAG TPA: protein kinase [Myxococcota bacterium]|nr:protein kinase [Myxococcota bacterium]HQE74336.1 protein kinase [Myxococcota bacterium]HQI61995.1 protein kinase [Myxococcota bacterium]HRR74729.1 protein kinase [Myxococcota bacterium]HRV18504.1 protein kinase [Myxococcota bacterium]